MIIRRRDRPAEERPEPGQMVRDSTIRGANVQVGGDVDGSLIAGDLNLRIDVSLPGPPPFHDRYAATRDAFATYHADVLDREVELGHMLDVLREPGSYHLVEAPAFTGKTAFVVELYRRLLDIGCPTVVFYIVDRYSNRSGDFVEAVVGQLIGILRSDERIAKTEERRAQFLRMWDEFAALGTAERPAVLLVDGLDEQFAADAISPMLPERVTGHAHIVVTTRSLPNPRAAVPRHHSLGAAQLGVVPLSTSKHATARRDDAKRHLEGYLTSADPVRERIAALFLVAGAPLSRHDLADMLGSTVGQVARHLHNVERCLLPITTETGETGYVWGHSSYSQFVHDWIGPVQRGEAVQQIVECATRYAAAAWPETTPPYLLHGLHDFLREQPSLANADFMTVLVSHARRQRLLATLGHDRVFLENITIARRILEKGGAPSAGDLEQMFRLEVHHVVAVSSSPFLPPGVLRLLVLSGKADQAEGIARASEERFRAGALAEVSEALADIGRGERAGELADLSWMYASAPESDHWVLDALRSCARAARIAGTAMRPPPLGTFLRARDPTLTVAVARVFLEMGAHDAARAALDDLSRAERGEIHEWVLADAAYGRFILGDLHDAWSLAKSAVATMTLLAEISGPEIAPVIKGLVHAGSVDKAVELARATVSDRNGELRACLNAALAEALAETGREQHAREILNRELHAAVSIDNPYDQTSSLACLRRAQAATGHADLSAIDNLLCEAEDLGGTDGPRAMVSLGWALLSAGRPADAASAAQRALALTRHQGRPFMDYNLHDLCRALIESGDHSGAREIAEANPNMAWQVKSVRAVEFAEAAAGLPLPDHRLWTREQRARLAVVMAGVERTRHQALALATDLVEDVTPGNRPLDRERSYAAMIAVDALHRAADIDTCEAVLSKVNSVAWHARALAKLSGLCRTSDAAAADRLFAAAVSVACRVRKADTRVLVLSDAVHAAGPLSPATPGLSRLVATAKRALGKLTSLARVELGALMAIALWEAGRIEHTRDFANLAQREATDDDDAWDGRYELCRALAFLGNYETALSLAHGDEYIEVELANIAADNGDLTVASRVAELVFEMTKDSSSDYEDVSVLLDTLLRAGRSDHALSLFTRYGGDRGEHLAYKLFRELAATGHEYESLRATRDIDLHTERIAALIGWASAPVWSPEVRARNLRLLKESARSAFRP